MSANRIIGRSAQRARTVPLVEGPRLHALLDHLLRQLRELIDEALHVELDNGADGVRLAVLLLQRHTRKQKNK